MTKFRRWVRDTFERAGRAAAASFAGGASAIGITLVSGDVSAAKALAVAALGAALGAGWEVLVSAVASMRGTQSSASLDKRNEGVKSAF